MRFFLLLFSIIFINPSLWAQENSDYKEMFQNAEAFLYTQPDESIKIALHILQNSKNDAERTRAQVLNAEAYYIKGEIDNAINAGVAAKMLSETSDDIPLQLHVSVATIHVLNHLGMDVVAQQYYANTSILAQPLTNDTISFLLKGGKELIAAYEILETKDFEKAFENFTDAHSFFQKIPDPILSTETTAAKAELYLKFQPVDSAKANLETILENSAGEHPNNYLKMVVQNQLGTIFFLKKEYSKSVESYQAALKIAKQFNNKRYQSQLAEGLSLSYLALEDTQQFYSYKKAENQLLNEVETDEEKAVNSIYNYVNENNTAKRDVVKKEYQENIVILAGLLFLTLLTWLVLRLRYRYRTKQYSNFITYFENRQKEKEILPEREISKSQNIPKETEKAIAQKLNQFENSKLFTKKDMSLALLASHFDTNTKYLSEIINTRKRKNFNSYINELRINYIIDKLKNNRSYLNYKISYLAEESGFSSHSSFATVFKAVTGISPTVFIELLNTKSKTNKTVYEDAE